jgi:HD-GYP domain-containing protein (c-di-GMP phosphodiesterase class II)
MVVLFQEIADRFLMTPRQPVPQPSQLDFLIAASKSIDMLEGRPMRHGLKIAAIAGTIAKVLGLGEREIHSVVCAGLLHDVGLARIASNFAPKLPAGMSEKEAFYAHTLLNARVVGIPVEKRFSDDAYNILITHPQAASHFIESVHLSGDIREMVATHHELCDGSGYPFGLMKDNIPIGGRILSFADTVESVMGEVTGLTTRKIALESFLDIKATHKFDHDVADAFRSLILDEEFLRKLYSLEVEDLVRQLCPGRQLPLSAKICLDIARALSQLPDGLLPQYTLHHSEKVAHYALKIADYLGIHREQSGQLILAGLLHDMGKLAIPMASLSKEGPLSDEEMDSVLPHPHYSEEILKVIPGFDNIALWCGEHHERMNGRGYPASKKGFEISVGGRIIAIADVFDVLTSARPYRKEPYEPMDALPILGQGRFRLYDSQLVSVLRTVVLETEIILK